MQAEELFALVFVIAMFCGVFIIFMGLRQRSLQLEMRHRERMAMIERGQVPGSDSGGRDFARRIAPREGGSSRAMSIGIMVIGLGLALMFIIGIAGDTPEVGVGIGGAIAIVGGAFVVRSLVVRPAVAPPRIDTPVDRPEEPSI
jgi:hypothetical protein